MTDLKTKSCHLCSGITETNYAVNQSAKTYNPMPSAGNLGTRVKRGKPWNQCQAGENLKLVSREGKRTYSGFQLSVVSQSHSNYSDKLVQTETVNQSEFKAYTRIRHQARKTRGIINWLKNLAQLS